MKNYLFTVLLLICSLALNAQRFSGGVIGGIAGSQVAGDTYNGYRKAGIYAGFWVQYPVSQNIALQTELVYTQKGSRHNPDEKHNDPAFYLMRLGYIEMPFLFQYSINSGLSVEAGPSFGLLLHSNETLDYQHVSYGGFALLNPSFMGGFCYKLNDRWSMHFRTANSVLSIRTGMVNGARRRFVDQGQYSDALILAFQIKL